MNRMIFVKVYRLVIGDQTVRFVTLAFQLQTIVRLPARDHRLDLCASQMLVRSFKALGSNEEDIIAVPGFIYLLLCLPNLFLCTCF